MKYKVYAILVAYNPEKNEIINAINRLLDQVDTIVLCNNSSYSLDDKIDRVHVIDFMENIGIAKAQSIGMKWAFDNGADFIIQMDQDSEPSKNMVQLLIDSYDDLSNRGFNIGLVGIQDYDKYTNKINSARLNKGKAIDGTPYKIVQETLSSGSLLPKSVYDIVGGMDDGLFIDAVDFEFCWRIQSFGYLIVRNTAALLGHRLGNGKKKILGLISVGVPAPIRHYYAFRNSIHLISRSYTPLYWKISSPIKNIFKLFTYPLFLDQGFLRLKYMLKGISDGAKNKYGRIDGKTWQ